MAAFQDLSVARRLLILSKTSARSGRASGPGPLWCRSLHMRIKASALSSAHRSSTPHTNPFARRAILSPLKAVRTIFIQTENTPNADALKFLPNLKILPSGLSSPFLEYLSPRSTLAPPNPSPLAARLLNIDGITSVFYGSDFITITKAPDANWAHVKPEVFCLITEAVTSGEQIVNSVESKSTEAGQEGGELDTLGYNENDSDVVGMIKELLETRIRPAIQEDGGDIEFKGFEDGYVLLKLRGACRTCDSSTVTLKNGIENMLIHYIEEVKGVTQVLDREEEIAMQEFAKFEMKLKEQNGPGTSASTAGKGNLDRAEA